MNANAYELYFTKENPTTKKKTDYRFLCQDCYTNPDNPKQVYSGYFPGEAPAPCIPGERYCLIRVDFRKLVNVPPDLDSGEAEDYLKTAFRLPAARDYHDLYPFTGQFLRKVLVQDDNTASLFQKKRPPAPEDLANQAFSVIEPQYERCDRFFDEFKTTTEQRLRFFYRITLGLKELYGSKYYGREIDAHRDLKERNIMLQNGSPVLIDLASIHFKKQSLDSFKTIQSPENAAPEDLLGFSPDGLLNASAKNVLPDSLRTSFEVSEKTDVFALAGILAHLFGNMNPIAAWCETRRSKNAVGTLLTNELTNAYEELLIKNNARFTDLSDAAENWLESGTSFEWGKDATDEIKAFFRRMSSINPANRPTMNEVLTFAERQLGLGVSFFYLFGAKSDPYRKACKDRAAVAFLMESAESPQEPSARASAQSAVKAVSPDRYSYRPLRIAEATTSVLFNAELNSMVRGITPDDPSAAVRDIFRLLASDAARTEYGLDGRDAALHIFAPKPFPLSPPAQKDLELLRSLCPDLYVELHAVGREDECGDPWFDGFDPLPGSDEEEDIVPPGNISLVTPARNIPDLEPFTSKHRKVKRVLSWVFLVLSLAVFFCQDLIGKSFPDLRTRASDAPAWVRFLAVSELEGVEAGLHLEERGEDWENGYIRFLSDVEKIPCQDAGFSEALYRFDLYVVQLEVDGSPVWVYSNSEITYLSEYAHILQLGGPLTLLDGRELQSAASLVDSKFIGMRTPSIPRLPYEYSSGSYLEIFLARLLIDLLAALSLLLSLSADGDAFLAWHDLPEDEHPGVILSSLLGVLHVLTIGARGILFSAILLCGLLVLLLRELFSRKHAECSFYRSEKRAALFCIFLIGCLAVLYFTRILNGAPIIRQQLWMVGLMAAALIAYRGFAVIWYDCYGPRLLYCILFPAVFACVIVGCVTSSFLLISIPVVLLFAAHVLPLFLPVDKIIPF